MGKSAIEWTERTWNPVRGCTRISEGCRNCYAETMAGRFCGPGQPYEGLVRRVGKGINEWGDRVAQEARWTGAVVFDPKVLADPLKRRKPTTYFVNSMSDLFHDGFTNEQIAAVFGVMAATPQHTFILLTKRSQRMREWFEWAIDGTARGGFYDVTFLNHLTSKSGLDWEANPKWMAHCEETENTCSSWPLPNVILGVSAENQATADERIPHLLATPAAVRMVSAEPLLGPLQLGPRLDWLIAGCESGRNARPCDVSWLRSLRDQCAKAGVPFFLKQAVGTVHESDDTRGLGAIEMGPGSKCKLGGIISLPYLDGVQWTQVPEMLK